MDVIIVAPIAMSIIRLAREIGYGSKLLTVVERAVLLL